MEDHLVNAISPLKEIFCDKFPSTADIYEMYDGSVQLGRCNWEMRCNGSSQGREAEMHIGGMQ
jgi:hypothetical protein